MWGQEMEEVAETLRGLNIEPLMAEGAAKRIHWLANQKLEHYFDGKQPKTYRDILDALDRQATQKADWALSTRPNAAFYIAARN